MSLSRGELSRPQPRHSRSGYPAVVEAHYVRVDRRVLRAAKRALRTGEQLVIVSETEVRLVNRKAA